ncbi:hypothetical protein FA13DRAFT_1637040 [Coprinellus micaceus]|uniref:Immunoreactive mannoprotein MP88 n=1 Tax=Coprinellus micaceus TaxID=71717 RepID=A0A4Y7SVT7_COPMI|nr:hypothetical protein FA13DRAFT_1637040 [Coprinellus micaceus]
MPRIPSFRHGVTTLAAVYGLIQTAKSQSTQTVFPAGVMATGTNGPTNPPEPTLGTPINQSSDARLLSVNGVDDFCLFAPPSPQNIGDSETYEVAWCTQPRNNARVIPDGTFSGVSFLKTDFYVQVMGYGNFTRLNIPAGDAGGELDPHGQFGGGNPIGGNVTSNITGRNEHFAEWMVSFLASYNQFCIRVCTNSNSTYSAEHMCWHELDEMGCEFVMPGNYQLNGTYETCDADVAYPPGWYPSGSANGTPVFSTFAQRYTGTLSNGQVYTVGDTRTPSGPASVPASSNCHTTSTISNGVPLTSLGFAPVTSASTHTTGATVGGAAETTGTTTARGGGSRANAGDGKRAELAKVREYSIAFLGSFLSAFVAILFFH